VAEWRRARGLLSADETVTWLDRWGLEMSDVHRHLGHAGDAPEPPVGDGLERVAWAEAVCSGALDGVAWGLAARVAVSTDPPSSESALDAAAFARLDAEFGRWREGIEAGDAVFAIIESNAAGWVSVVAHGLAFSNLDVAREALLCVRVDGLTFAHVSELSGAEVVESRDLLDDLGEPVRRLVASALPGDVLGPLADAGAYRLLKLVSKSSPDATDPVVLARARALAVTRALDRASAANIVWHDRL
jgi:hypothetical protein